MIKRHLDSMLTYFDHPISNAVAEGLNSKSGPLKRMRVDFGHLRVSAIVFCSIVAASVWSHRVTEIYKEAYLEKKSI